MKYTQAVRVITSYSIHYTKLYDTLLINPENINSEMISELLEIIKENKGETELRFMFYDPEDKISLPMFSRSLRVRLNNEFISYLEDHPGIDYKVN